MRLSLVIATSMTALALPAAAAAHGRGPAIAVDERVSIDTRPPGLDARVLDGDRSLWLRVAGGVRVVVLGSLGEPLLRFGDDGVWANRASPTAAADGVVASGSGWSRVAGGQSFAWHDHRLAPPRGGGSPVVGRWSVPVTVDGRRTALGGTFRRVRRPNVLPWVIGAAAAGAAIMGLAAARPSARPKLAIGLGVVGGTAAVATVTAFALRDAPTRGVRWFQVAAAVLVALACAITLALLKDSRRVTAAGAIGAVAAATMIGSLSIFLHGVVVSALAPLAARAVCATALVAGVAAAVVSFLADPVRERAR